MQGSQESSASFSRPDVRRGFADLGFWGTTLALLSWEAPTEHRGHMFTLAHRLRATAFRFRFRQLTALANQVTSIVSRVFIPLFCKPPHLSFPFDS